jgi:hypothetical protein
VNGCKEVCVIVAVVKEGAVFVARVVVPFEAVDRRLKESDAMLF